MKIELLAKTEKIDRAFKRGWHPRKEFLLNNFENEKMLLKLGDKSKKEFSKLSKRLSVLMNKHNDLISVIAWNAYFRDAKEVAKIRLKSDKLESEVIIQNEILNAFLDNESYKKAV